MSSDDTLSQRFGRDFPRGAVLFREGDRGDEMFVVQRGQVRISRLVAGVEKVLSTLGPGEFLGEMSVLSGRPRSATATCADDARLLVVDGRTVDAMLRANGEIAVRMIRKLADRLQAANEQIERLLLPDVTARLAHLLLALAEREPAGSPLPAASAELAARVGAEVPQVDQVLARLHRARVVALQDGRVAVPDAARLRQYLELQRMKAEFGEGP